MEERTFQLSLTDELEFSGEEEEECWVVRTTGGQQAGRDLAVTLLTLENLELYRWFDIVAEIQIWV